MSHKVIICGIDTSTIPKIKGEEMAKLLQRVREGDQQALNYFVLCNIRLVLSLVQRFNNRGNSDDLFQVGCVGLMKAVRNFDPSFNVRFSTYAVPMIIGEIRRFLRDVSSIKVSRSIRDTAYKALHAKEMLERSLERRPSMLEIAEEIDLPVKQVACALDAVSEPVSLYETTFSDGEDSLLLMEQLKDDKSSDALWLENSELYSALKTLPEKERKVLLLRYYIGKTQVEISQQIGISQAQVSRLEKTAITRLRKII